MNIDHPKKLKTLSEIKAAKKAFHKVFNTSYSFCNPFTSRIERKAIIFKQVYSLDEEHYQALGRSAQTLGESDAYVSEIEFYDEKEYLTNEMLEVEKLSEFLERTERIRNLKFEERDHWLVDLGIYPYHVIQIVMGNALYSTKGTWGILFSEFGHALIGGPTVFFQSLIEDIPDLENQVYDFLTYIHGHLIKYPDTTKVIKSWLPTMLDQIYGSVKGQDLLKKTNLNKLLVN